MVDAATRRKFEALVSAAFVDGFLAAPEREVLQQKAAALKIPAREMNEIIALGEQRKLSVSLPATSLERDALLEDLIEVVAADGRVEAPEYHLLARFAETLKIALPELRVRVNRRMQANSEPKTEVVRRDPPRSVPPPSRQTHVTAKRPEPPRPSSTPLAPSPAPVFEAPKFTADALPSMPPATTKHVDQSFPKQVNVANLPPVTLQLLRQSIMFDTESDSVLNISRTLSLSPSEATEIRRKIIEAFPDLKPASPPRPIRR
ncbi:MAG TPA: hypothetical protein VNM14_25440 [Planctomycetota bacterium]|jgi:uncharacterized tellurite resistance protein B-like protein|nr:hypothetical protein [Planctomycetota bacterium]